MSTSEVAKETFNAILTPNASRKRRRLNDSLNEPEASTSTDIGEEHYTTRVKDKRLQLSNPDRSRPVGTTTQQKKLKRRQQRCDVQPRKPKQAKKERQRVKHSDSTMTSYAALLPLSEMWQSYIAQFLSLHTLDTQIGTLSNNQQYLTPSGCLKPNATMTIQSQIVKADLLAAPIRVIRSNNPANVGISGIVARETASTFLIAKEDTSFVTVAKRDTTFVVEVRLKQSRIQIPIQGNALMNVFVVRATRKWKSRKTMDY